jgi:alpha-ribazole phosphatase
LPKPAYPTISETMPTVHLLRHGETEAGDRYCGTTDVALSARGWQQMYSATAGGSWKRIISSPLQRCAAFAAELARSSVLSCSYDADLREMHFGEWEGRSAADLMRANPEALRRFWADPIAGIAPGGESIADLQARVLAAWARIVSDPGGRDDRAAPRTLIVTHGGPIRVLLAARAGIALSGLLSIEVPHAALVAIATASDDNAVAARAAVGTPVIARKWR